MIERWIPAIRALTAEEAKALEQGLDLAALLVEAPRPLKMSQVQRLYDDLLAKRTRSDNSVIALGLAFGALFVNDSAYWARALYSDGEETVVVTELGDGSQSISAPISMIQKRLDRRERANLEGIRSALIKARQ